MRLKPFVGKLVTVILKPEVSLPSLDWFATTQLQDRSMHLIGPSTMVPRPPAAMSPEGNVALNVAVKPTDDDHEFNLVYFPWMSAQMMGPGFVLRVHEESVVAVIECTSAPPKEEIEKMEKLQEQLRRQHERQQLAQVGPAPLVR